MNVGRKLIPGAVLIGTLSACGRGGEPDAVDIATAYSNVAQRKFYIETEVMDLGVLPPEPGTEASVPRLSAHAGLLKFRYTADKVECKKVEGIMIQAMSAFTIWP